MRFFAAIMGVFGVLVSCAGTKQIVEPTYKTREIDTWIQDKKRFEAVMDWAYPMASQALNAIANAGLIPPGSNVNSINLVGNPNYVRMKGDSIQMYVPFFGERQMVTSYNPTQGGFEFDGIPKKLDIQKNEQKQEYTIRFTAKMEDGNEYCDITLNIYPDQSISMNINSTHRISINYKGKISAFLQE